MAGPPCRKVSKRRRLGTILFAAALGLGLAGPAARRVLAQAGTQELKLTVG